MHAQVHLFDETKTSIFLHIYGGCVCVCAGYLPTENAVILAMSAAFALFLRDNCEMEGKKLLFRICERARKKKENNSSSSTT